MIEGDNQFLKIEKFILNQKKVLAEIKRSYFSLEKTKDSSDKRMVVRQIKFLTDNFKKLNVEVKNTLGKIVLSNPLLGDNTFDKKVKEEGEKEVTVQDQEDKKGNKDNQEEEIGGIDKFLKSKGGKLFGMKQISARGLEKETIKRIKTKEKKKKVKVNKDKSEYFKIAGRFFSKFSGRLINKNTFRQLEEDLSKANLNYTPKGYVSVVLMTTFLSLFVAGFLFLFFLFFEFSTASLGPFAKATDPVNLRFFKVIWILIVVPIGTFLVMYIYPSLERKSAEAKINSELPFATIHMSAISGSMINPLKIFEIISSTKDYPALEKEFTKLINEINIYGYDLISALKNTAKNSSSKRLSELLIGLATTLNSGGDLTRFFDKRAESLLFNYRLQQQRSAKHSETMMDMYISMLIAAPMILMLLMMIMKISGLGISMSIGSITLITILGVVGINIFFIVFLNLRRES